MTLLADPQRPATEPTREIPLPEPNPRVISIRQVVLIAVAIVILLAVSWAIVEDPVAHVWYNARQQQRASGINQRRSSTSTGQTLAILQAPDIGLNLAVVEGDSGDLLRGGPGHSPGSPLPGRVGNSVIFGHSDGWGAPFAHLSRLVQGNMLYVRLHGSSQVLEFTVTSVTTVGSDRALLRATNDRRLTLVTGNGGRTPAKYLVVTAVSGNTGTYVQNSHPVANPTTGSVLLNRDIGLFLLRGAGAAVIVVVLRRRYRAGVVAALSSPLVLAALLPLMLAFDRVLSPLG